LHEIEWKNNGFLFITPNILIFQETELSVLARVIFKGLHLNILNNFFTSQDTKIYNKFLCDRQRIDKKDRLIKRKENERRMTDIKYIKYYWREPSTQSSGDL